MNHACCGFGTGWAQLHRGESLVTHASGSHMRCDAPTLCADPLHLSPGLILTHVSDPSRAISYTHIHTHTHTGATRDALRTRGAHRHVATPHTPHVVVWIPDGHAASDKTAAALPSMIFGRAQTSHSRHPPVARTLREPACTSGLASVSVT
eukprot:4143220-Prymnesium_polylepis.1